MRCGSGGGAQERTTGRQATHGRGCSSAAQQQGVLAAGEWMAAIALPLSTNRLVFFVFFLFLFSFDRFVIVRSCPSLPHGQPTTNDMHIANTALRDGRTGAGRAERRRRLVAATSIRSLTHRPLLLCSSCRCPSFAPLRATPWSHTQRRCKQQQRCVGMRPAGWVGRHSPALSLPGLSVAALVSSFLPLSVCSFSLWSSRAVRRTMVILTTAIRG